MKGTARKLTGCVAAALVAAALSAAAPADRGGPTFDFAAISARHFRQLDGARAVPVDAWRTNYVFLHNANVPRSDPRRARVKGEVIFTRRPNGYHIFKKPSLLAACDNDASVAEFVSGGVTQELPLADSNGGEYRLAMRFRMRHALGRNGSVLVFPRTGRKDIGGYMALRFWDSWGEKPSLWAQDIVVPAGCDCLQLVVRVDGIGELEFEDLTIARIPPKKPITLLSQPFGYLDSRFAFSAGQAGVPLWVWKRNDEKKYNPAKFTFILTVPRGYELLDGMGFNMAKATSATGKDGSVTWRIPADGSYSGCVPDADVNTWVPLSACIVAAPDAPRGRLTLGAEYEGRRVTDECSLDVFTLPRISAPKPQRFANGIYLGGRYVAFRETRAREAFADLFTSVGADWVCGGPDAETRAIWRRKGLRFITPETSWCANGFMIGNPRLIPPSDRFVWLDRPRNDRAVCPTTIYEESPFFRTNTLSFLRKIVEGCDGLWANWEPYMFARCGCMCPRCRAAFARYVGVTDEEMAKDWPQELAPGGKWASRIQRFRSVEHGKVVRTLARHICEFTGGARSLGFIPGINIHEMSSEWRPRNLAAEVQAIDYAGSLRWINPWGPYPWWNVRELFSPSCNDFLGYFYLAKDVRLQVNADYGVTAPKLVALPHGFQLKSCLTEPESISLSLDSFFFNRWEATLVYAFPKGYDARYWRAFAEATARAARYEPFVLDGTRCDDDFTLTLDASRPFPPPSSSFGNEGATRERRPTSLLQHAAYRLGGRAIVAAFNFADHDVAHFTLKGPGGLSRTLAVPAMRCRVFELPMAGK